MIERMSDGGERGACEEEKDEGVVRGKLLLRFT